MAAYTPKTSLIASTVATGTSSNAVATTEFVANHSPNAVSRVICRGAGSLTAGQLAGLYSVPVAGQPMTLTSAGTTHPIMLFRASTELYPTLDNKTAKYYLRAHHFTNDVAMDVTVTFGIYPITRSAVVSNDVVYTYGTVIADSTVAFTNQSSDSLSYGTSEPLELVAGYYAVAAVLSGTVPIDAHTHATCNVFIRNV
jgi:hypothetical protein